VREDVRYLLRVRTDGSREDWRATLAELRSGETWAFADLEALHRHLRERTSGTDPDATSADPRRRKP